MSSAVCAGFVAEHERIDELLQLATDALDTGDLAVHAQRWADCAEAIYRHLDGEERLLLPRLLALAARQARALVAEHSHLRSRMAELALPWTSMDERRAELNRFRIELYAHERHEESAIYPWADENLDPQDRASLLEK